MTVNRKCEEFLRIDMVQLRRQGLLEHGAVGTMSWSRFGTRVGAISVSNLADRVLLRYRRRDGETWHHVEESVPFNWTDTRFGGRRQWLKCVKCAGLFRVLYGVPFRCRRCHGLHYSSQYEPAGLGAVDQADKIRKRLGDKVGSAFDQDEFPPRPKGMHRKTHRRLKKRYDRLQLKWTVSALARFGITG